MKVLIAIALLTWLYNMYSHFYKSHESNVMLAFVGRENVRMFEHEFQHYDLDLWAFGHLKRKSSRIRFVHDHTPFEVFNQHHYQHLLLIHKIYHIPAMFDSEVPVIYKHKNITVASLWPKISDLPQSQSHIDEYIKEHKNIEKVHI